MKHSVIRLDFIEPQLATLDTVVPVGAGWVYEIKLDGYRVITTASGKAVRCWSRNGLDWTHRFGDVPAAIAALQLDRVILDGEMVVLDAGARSSFTGLQQALSAGGAGLSYFVFDLLAEAGHDVRGLALLHRKDRLRKILRHAKPPIYYSQHLTGDGVALHRTMCERQLEGLVAKRGDRPYRSGRGADWIKVKCGLEQEFIVIGYTVSDKGRPFSSLLLGAYDGGELRHIGRVGTGFDERELIRLAQMMMPLRRDTAPVKQVMAGQVRRQLRWIAPRLVVQVGYTGWTADGLLRHPRYLGLREDKRASEVALERARNQ